MTTTANNFRARFEPVRARLGSARTRARAALTVTMFAAFAGITGAGPAFADPKHCGGPDANSRLCTPEDRTTWMRNPDPYIKRPSNSDSSSDASTWVADHALIIVIVLAVVGWIVWAIVSENNKEKAEAATLARGRAIANQHHAALVEAARAAVPVVPVESYDPLNLGVAAPPTPEPELPPKPPMLPADLKRFEAFNAVTEWVPGTAFATLVDRSGDWSRAAAAWVEASVIANCGWTGEDGAFVPAATVVSVAALRDGSGDVELTVDPVSYETGEAQLNRTRDHLVRTARVATSTPFVRDPATDRFTTRLSMNSAEPAPAAPADPTSKWEW